MKFDRLEEDSLPKTTWIRMFFCSHMTYMQESTSTQKISHWLHAACKFDEWIANMMGSENHGVVLGIFLLNFRGKGKLEPEVIIHPSPKESAVPISCMETILSLLLRQATTGKQKIR